MATRPTHWHGDLYYNKQRGIWYTDDGIAVDPDTIFMGTEHQYMADRGCFGDPMDTVTEIVSG